ncbi:MAG: class A beta-lactamase-related serine hydrolase [Clostridiaceae bacterium]|nr:class A beta-lactamase-related serine hydrolase [Clostridiaceae bacterium]
MIKFISSFVIILLVTLSFPNLAYADVEEESLIKDLLFENKSMFNFDIINNPNKYNLQILYTEINRDSQNIPIFTSYKYNVDAKKYFYPASSIKLSACILSLDKINNLKINGLTKYTTMNIGATGNGQIPRKVETISNYIQKILLYSDNDSFSRLYEFLGQKYYNDTLSSKGYKDSKIIHRLSVNSSYENNKYTNPITFYSGNKKLYDQPLIYSNTSYSNKDLTNISVGKGETSYSSKNFTYKNYMSIEDLQNMVKTVFFNSYMIEDRQFNLTVDDTNFLKKYMKGTGNVTYKYLVCGGNSKIPSGIEIYNKIGIAYGQLTDNSYIVDKNSGNEFMLTATICVNNNGTYDYYSKGMPFLKNLGLMFLEYNKNR